MFAIFSVALSGMQVALATDQLSHDSAFYTASYVFAVFSLVALAGSVGASIAAWMLLLVYFYLAAKVYHHKVQSARRKSANARTSV